jgi:opacity protein-like surface antigen
MRNLKPILMSMLFVTSVSFAQKIKITGGVNLMDINYAISDTNTDDPTDDPTDTARNGFSKQIMSNNSKTSNNETGFYLGLALTDITLFNKFELQPEVRYVGVKDFNQIQAPILIGYKISDDFIASTGPNFGFFLDAGDGVKSFNFAIDFGLSYDVSEKLSIDARYDWGQTNLLNRGDSNNYIKINNIQLGLAYSFGK